MPIVDIEGISISFPYPPYPCQSAFIKSVLNALNNKQNAALESPTGTGKTLSLLCSVLAWLQVEKVKLAPQIVQQVALSSNKNNTETTTIGFPKIIYASRTHSQLAQVVGELNKTSYKHVNTVLLASRDQLCVNDQVKKEKNSHAKGMLCRNLVSTRKCKHYLSLETDEDMITQLYENNGDVLTIENLVSKAKKLNHCPFFKSRKDFNNADLILLPYNYILDPKVRAAQKIDLSGNIIIFDEAHNLENICEDSGSINISSKDIGLCLKEAKAVMELYLSIEESVREEMDNTDLGFGEKNIEKKFLFEKNDAAQLILMLQKLEEAVDNIDFSKGKFINDIDGYVFEGSYMIEILKKSGIEKHSAAPISLLIDQMGQFIVSNKYMANEFDLTSSEKLLEFSNLVSTVYTDSYENVNDNKSNTTPEQIASKLFKLYINKEGNLTNLHYWCFSAGFTMRYLQSRGVHSIIVASGTLSPLNQFVNSMGIDFPITLENGHAAKSSQILSGAIKHSDYGELLLGTYKNRDNKNYINGLGAIIYEASKIIPQGMIVFFPSYAPMYTLLKIWKENRLKNGNSIWNELEKNKCLYVEPKDKSDVPGIMANFELSVENDRGAILFAVCRGKMSEGIDFKDSQSRAVFVIGIPFPPLKDPKVVLKKIYLSDNIKSNSLTLAPDEWYKLEGIRAVNQAIGRVIRHKNDFGAVFLLDQRFATMEKKHFPSWMRDSITPYENSKDYLKECELFFKRNGAIIPKTTILQNTPRKRSKEQSFCETYNSNNECVVVKQKKLQIDDHYKANFSSFLNLHYDVKSENTPQIRKRKVAIVKVSFININR
uniref:Helicase ATP-binding domain-containing protein n=1 Tax=Parastrongyloides trichosuri TaxID=131310 RepID=A0A0N4ZRV0_PARTI